MDSIFQRAFSDPLCLEENVVQQGIERCPFLRNINEPTSFSLSSVKFPVPARGAKGPIFEDGPNFDMAFRVFHGRDGVVPLSEGSFPQIEKPLPKPNPEFNPLAAKAATISLSAFGGFFSFGDFSNKHNKKNSNKKNPNNLPQNGGQSNYHEALSNEWLEMGQCPLAKSYRALSGVVPLVAKMMTPPAGMKLRCPPAVVAARAALSRTAFAKGLRPQPLPTKILVIALLGMAANVPLVMKVLIFKEDIQLTVLIFKEDIQVSYLELIKLPQLNRLLGNYNLVECQIMKISNIDVLLCNIFRNVTTELFLFIYPAMLVLLFKI